MILKRYGTAFHTVDLNFESKALNEIGFRRNRVRSVPVEELESDYRKVVEHEILAEAEGRVQDHTEQDLLDKLQARVEELVGELGEEEFLVFENEDGTDYPKTRQKTRNVVEEGENRLHFHYSVFPALRFGVYRKV